MVAISHLVLAVTGQLNGMHGFGFFVDGYIGINQLNH
jgi:hypothetical protein